MGSNKYTVPKVEVFAHGFHIDPAATKVGHVLLLLLLLCMTRFGCMHFALSHTVNISYNKSTRSISYLSIRGKPPKLYPPCYAKLAQTQADILALTQADML